MESCSYVNARGEKCHGDEELFVLSTKKNGVFSLDAFDGVIVGL